VKQRTFETCNVAISLREMKSVRATAASICKDAFLTRSVRATNAPEGHVSHWSLVIGHWSFLLLFSCLTLSLSLAGCGSTPPAPAPPPAVQSDASNAELAAPPRFVDVTETSGVRSTYRNGEEAGERSIVESLGGGVGACDYDRDGLLDLFFPGGGTLKRGEPLTGIPGTLWRNLGEMKFADATAPAAIDRADYYSHGCAIADYDNDGFPDVLVTGYGGLNLFHNQGDGTFVERHQSAGLDDKLWSSSAAWGDFDGDGHLDLYIAHYVNWSWENHPVCPASIAGERETCSPLDFEGLPGLVYLSNGDGTFRPGGSGTEPQQAGKGLGVIATDVNADSRLDIYVANDTTPNFLLINQDGGKFSEEGVVSGTAFDQRGLPNGSMGVAVLDYNNDLRPDLWVTNYENETFALYHNDGGGMFRCLTEATGITALGTLYVGFGTVAADFTHSGFEDLVVANGHVMQYPRYSTVAQEALYLRNEGRGKFLRQKFPPDSYFSRLHRGRGVVAADLDKNGTLDLVFSHTNEPAAILQQQTKLVGSWVGLNLVGRRSNRDAIGARVVLVTSRGKQLRMIVGGGSYLSQNPYMLRFGLPPGTSVSQAEITWPDGSVQRLSNLSPGTVHDVIEPH